LKGPANGNESPELQTVCVTDRQAGRLMPCKAADEKLLIIYNIQQISQKW
jgi:hypothetical protein